MIDEISSCHMCGRSTIARRFCSECCRAACDAGFPRPDTLYNRKVVASKLADWKVIAPAQTDHYCQWLLGLRKAHVGALLANAIVPIWYGRK
jgi:hypothetical protein